MAESGKFRFGAGTRADLGRKGSIPNCVQNPNHAFISSANVNLLEQFVEFCKSKKLNQQKESAQEINVNCNLQEKAHGESIGFKEKLIMYFGDHLPLDVVDELCKLVHENSYDKCSFCLLPTESLILSVLQILLDAGRRKNVIKVDDDAPASVAPNIRTNDNVRSASLIGKDFRPSLENNNGQKYCSRQFNRHSSQVKSQGNNCKRSILHDFIDPENVCPNAAHNINPLEKNSSASREDCEFKDGKITKTPFLVLDTPVVIPQGIRHFDDPPSLPAHIPVMKKKARTEVHTSQRPNQGTKVFQGTGVLKELGVQPKGSPDVEIVGATSFRDRCFQFGKLTDQLYNKRSLTTMAAPPVIDLTGVRAAVDCSHARAGPNRPQKHIPSRVRFPITDEERGYYIVICGLAHSQWSGFKAVEFSKTNVSYQSLGESVEPMGKVDNFFVAGMCRKFFEDEHPRKSKKHFFYPKVGGCLYTYNCPYDFDTVQNSFLGANSAFKLHLSDKLCFPVVLQKHWFVFIVDLKNKMFVFLDSYYNGNHTFQIEARDKLINAFKECWYQHAEIKSDLDDFSLQYPLVPKQQNTVDCGIFVVKFMELWDKNVDLRQLFGQSDIPNIRVKLAVDLFFSKWNSIDKSLVLDFYKQGIDPRSCT